MGDKQAVRCPCCDSLFKVEVTGIRLHQGEVVLDKTKEQAKKALAKGAKQTIEETPNNMHSYG